MRRPQLKVYETSVESSKPLLLDTSPNQSFNNSLNQSDFNHTILRINELEICQMNNSKSKSKAINLSRNSSKELDYGKSTNDNDSENQSYTTHPLDILIHDTHSLNDNLPTKNSTGLAKDFNTIVFLLFLYFLQGIPLGLTGALPFILQSQKVSYSDQVNTKTDFNCFKNCSHPITLQKGVIFICVLSVFDEAYLGAHSRFFLEL
jgi:hypothetical protein